MAPRSCDEPVCEPADEGIACIEFRLRHEPVGLVRLHDGAGAADDGGNARLLVEPTFGDVTDLAGGVRSRQLGNERGRGVPRG